MMRTRRWWVASTRGGSRIHTGNVGMKINEELKWDWTELN